MTKPIVVHGYATGPNPLKVVIILEELGVPYDIVYQDMATLHTPVFEKYNPNGRVPAIEDPNTGIVLWESCAIVEYLIDTYDRDNKLHFTTSPEKYFTSQYLYFQGTGQGPYFGQAAWFVHFHSERIASATDRYLNEIKRVTKVLDGILEGKDYLVGNKCTYADLSFIPWFIMVPWIGKNGELADLEKDHPNYARWLKSLTERPAVKKVLEARAAKIAEQSK